MELASGLIRLRKSTTTSRPCGLTPSQFSSSSAPPWPIRGQSVAMCKRSGAAPPVNIFPRRPLEPLGVVLEGEIEYVASVHRLCAQRHPTGGYRDA